MNTMSRILARLRAENEDLRARLLAANNEVKQLRVELEKRRREDAPVVLLDPTVPARQ
jgi:hypothetical protein